jgi:hypothetical protein
MDFKMFASTQPAQALYYVHGHEVVDILSIAAPSIEIHPRGTF